MDANKVRSLIENAIKKVQSLPNLERAGLFDPDNHKYVMLGFFTDFLNAFNKNEGVFKDRIPEDLFDQPSEYDLYLKMNKGPIRDGIILINNNLHRGK